MVLFLESALLLSILITLPYITQALSIPSVSNSNPGLNLHESQVSSLLKVCQSSSACPDDQACIQKKCSDPCNGSCAPDAVCRVIQHRPTCSCPLDTFGDPSKMCGQRQEHLRPVTAEVTSASTPRYISNDYQNSKPENLEQNSRTIIPPLIVTLSEVKNSVPPPQPLAPQISTTSTISVDTGVSILPNRLLPAAPLPPVLSSCQQGTCGINAVCTPDAICECRPGFDGDPLSHCKELNKASIEKEDGSMSTSTGESECKQFNYCAGEPCGALGTCTPLKIGSSSCPIGRSCQCKEGYVGIPPNCFECVSKSECPSTDQVNPN